MSAAQPVSSLVVRQRAVRSSDDATSRVALATSMPTLEPSAMGLLSSDPSTVRARPCECELEIRSTVRALTVDRRTRRPSYTTVSEPKGLRATVSVIERSKDTKGGCGEAPRSKKDHGGGSGQVDPPPCGREYGQADN